MSVPSKANLDMNLTRKVEVLKRDGNTEVFDPAKLTGMLRKGMHRLGIPSCNAGDLGAAVEIYLQRAECYTVSTQAVFEMGVKTLRYVEMDDVAEVIEQPMPYELPAAGH